MAKLGTDACRSMLNSAMAAVVPVDPLVVRRGPGGDDTEFRQTCYTIKERVEVGPTEEMVIFLHVQVCDGETLQISAGPGAVRPCRCACRFIPHSECIVVIEDTAELRINNPTSAAECQIEMLETKVNYDTLSQASLRWRPDRIILAKSEVRKRGHFWTLQHGHGGSMATINANSP